MGVVDYKDFNVWDAEKKEKYLNEVETDYVMVCHGALCSSKEETRNAGQMELYRLKFFLNECYRRESNVGIRLKAEGILKKIKAIEEERELIKSETAETMKTKAKGSFFERILKRH